MPVEKIRKPVEAPIDTVILNEARSGRYGMAIKRRGVNDASIRWTTTGEPLDQYGGKFPVSDIDIRDFAHALLEMIGETR